MPEKQARARAVKLLVMDVDGTLTDGAIFVLPDGEEVKSYNVKDGLGLLMAHLAGLQTAIITGKTSKALEKRAEKLQIAEVHQGILDKRPVLEDILKRHGLRPEDVAYIGDDLGDLEVMRLVGLAAAVADAHPAVKGISHFICKHKGGRGAVRELIEYILTAQDKWAVLEKKAKEILPRRVG